MVKGRKNNFDKRGSELMPRELMERAADPALVPDEALVAVLIKTVLTPGDDKENLYALLLNNKNRPVCEPLRISRGTADSVPAFASDVFKEALKWGAMAVMVAHNHPSGDSTPSKDDLKFTERLVALAKIAELRFLDHLVLGDSNYISIRSLGEISFG